VSARCAGGTGRGTGCGGGADFAQPATNPRTTQASFRCTPRLRPPVQSRHLADSCQALLRADDCEQLIDRLGNG
jgi:hypothetical protein